MEMQHDSAGRPFIAAADLPTETHARMLAIFEDEVAVARAERPMPDLFTVAARAVERVHARAIVTGTKRDAAEVIRTSAEKLYADVLADQ